MIGTGRVWWLRLVVYLSVLAGLMGGSFAFGLYSGAERTPVFEFVKSLKTRVEDLGVAPGDVSAAETNTRSIVHLYDAEDFARAQAEDTPPADHLEWAGFYRIANSEKDLDGLTPLNPWLPPVIQSRLQPWARAKMEATNGIADDTGQICQPNGQIRATGFAASFLWLPASDKIVIVNGIPETTGIQRIYLNRTHPRNLRPTWNGDSIGYWDKETLVVDTVGFNDKSWLHSTMEPHTEELRWIQRVKRVRDGAYLEIQYTVEDRKALTSAYTYTRYYRRVADSMPEVICNDELQMWRDFRNEALQSEHDRARTLD
jgi:hypothetical protein